MPLLTIVNPYYRNPEMLQLLIDNFDRYDSRTKLDIEWIIVDDCSPEPAAPIIEKASPSVLHRIHLYRVLDDIPWNQHGARNLGAQQAVAPWLLMADMDRMVLAADMRMVLDKIRKGKMTPDHHYKARGYNIKDKYAISEDKPIVNQFWCTKEAYWDCGGYDEDYCGMYGGDGPLLRSLERNYPLVTMKDIIMFRYDRHIVPDATTQDLDRSRDGYGKKTREKRRTGNFTPTDHIRFKWERIQFDNST